MQQKLPKEEEADSDNRSEVFRLVLAGERSQNDKRTKDKVGRKQGGEDKMGSSIRGSVSN